jgi:hypothetical protein
MPMMWPAEGHHSRLCQVKTAKAAGDPPMNQPTPDSALLNNYSFVVTLPK